MSAASNVWNTIPVLSQWPSGANANPLTPPDFLEHQPTDGTTLLKAQLESFQLTSAFSENVPLIDYLENKYVLFSREAPEHSSSGRYRRELDDGRPRIPMRTMVVIDPATKGNSKAGSVIRWGENQMAASKLIFKMAWEKGEGGLMAYISSGLVAIAGSLAQTLGATMDGTLFDKEPHETPAEWLLRLTSNIIMPPEAVAARAFKIMPALSTQLRTLPANSARRGVRVTHEPTGLTQISSRDNTESGLHIKVQDKYYPINENAVDGTFSLSNAHKIYFNHRTGEWREFWSGNTHLTAKSLSAIPDELLSLSPGDNSILAFNGRVSAEGKVWTVPNTGKYYLEVMKRNPSNPNSVITQYVEGHLEERFFSINQDALPVNKQTLLEWKSATGKWEVVTNAGNTVTAKVTSAVFNDLPASILVQPLFKFESASALAGFKNVFRSPNTQEVFIYTGNTRRGLAQYIKVVQEAGDGNRFKLEIPDGEMRIEEMRYYLYHENGEFTLDEVVSCRRIKRADDNPCLAGTSREEPDAKRARIEFSPQQIVQEKLAEIESNPLELVPINRAGEHDILHDLAIEAIRSDYQQQIMNNVPVEQLTDVFKAQARTAKIISEYYAEQLLKGSVAGAKEFSYILLDKLLDAGLSGENLMVVHMTINGVIKYTALLYYPEHSMREIIVTAAPFLFLHEFNVFELVGAIKFSEKPIFVLNPWSAENTLLQFDVGTTREAVQQKMIKMLQEAGITSMDKSMQRTQGSTEQNNRLFLENIKLSLPESLADPASAMELQEKVYLNFIAAENYRIRVRGESVLNEPAGINGEEPLTLRDRFVSARAIIDELSNLGDPAIKEFVMTHFGGNNFLKKVDIFRRYLAHAKSDLARYFSGGDRLGKLVLLEPENAMVESSTVAFVTDGVQFHTPILSIVNAAFWKSTTLSEYAESIQTLLHEISHVKESVVPTSKTPLLAFDFIYNAAELFNPESNQFNFRMDYYSSRQNNQNFIESNEANLKLMNYDEYLFTESKYSENFNLIKDRNLFERKVLGELEHRVKLLDDFLKENENVKITVNAIRSRESPVHRLFGEINTVSERLDIPQKKYDSPSLTQTYESDQTKRQLDPAAIMSLREWIHEISANKEIRAAVVLNNAESIAYYQLLFAAKNKFVAKHLINEGVLPKPDPNLPWEASDDEGSEVESSNK
ncbi:hypothetical protein SPM24T3_00010 [Serratia sp. M24T3]|nr:hypothetical protein SPM24T3_00010 [Serratia sp. M24T3]